ncbi:MAG: hypothetical protein HWE25_01025 [Alphaproteobacteria bacterium]|nr:hypothetical protein [Alphaproteobacteria bacterium]
MVEIPKQNIDRVLAALGNDKFKWRTVRGLAKEAEVAEDEVRHVLKLKEDAVVQSSVPSTKGEDLFTLRETFASNNSIGSQLLGAFKGRAR